MGIVGPHGGGEREVLGRRGMVPGAGQGEPEPEVRIVVRRTRLHDHPEILGRLSVAARVELGPGQGLPDAAGVRLGRRGALQDLGRGRRAAPAEELQAAPVPAVHVVRRSSREELAREVFFRMGIGACTRSF